MQGIEIPIGANLDQLKAAQKEIKDRLNQIKNDGDKAGAGLGNGLAKGSDRAAFALQNLGRVAQDAPFGFIGIQNNLNPLLESFTQLRKESGSTQGALKALVGSLVGAGGIGLALSAVTAAFTFAQMGLRAWGITSDQTKDKVNETTKSLKEQRDEFLKSPYENAAIELNELTSKVSLAKQGFIDKGAVLKEYNESIGKTIGKVTDLDTAEQNLVKNGDKYLQLMLLKAKAEFAFKKAAEQSYEIIKKQNQIEVNKNPLGLDKKSLDQLNKFGKQPVTAIRLQTEFDEQVEIKKLENFSNRAVNIAKSAQQEVIDFAKQSGFNLNGLFTNIDESNKTLKTQQDILKELNLDLKAVQSQSLTTFGDANKAKINAYNSAIKELIQIGAPKTVIAQLQQDLLKLDQSGFKNVGKQVGLKLGLGIEQGLTTTLPVIATDITKNLKTPLSDWQTYVNENLLPKVQSNFETFFNDILMRGKLSFESLGKAIINTFLSILASDAARQLTNLLKFNTGSQYSDSKKSGIGLIQGIGGLLAKGAGGAAIGAGAATGVSAAAASTGGVILGAGGAGLGATAGATAASGGLLLPILAGVAAVAGIASLLKKKPQAPLPVASSTISTSAAGSAQDFGGGRVVFEISGTNLVGVLNRAGAKLQRFGP